MILDIHTMFLYYTIALGNRETSLVPVGNMGLLHGQIHNDL
jgi:hypothetical protein